MKTKIMMLLLSCSFIMSVFGQNISKKEWIKNSSTSTYSLKYEKKISEDIYLKNQKDIVSNIDIQSIYQDLKNNDEELRLGAIRILGLIPVSNQISTIENLLVNDPSINVRIQCVKSLKYLKSISSIPLLIKTLNTEDQELKLQSALTLAALGEKTECFQTLMELGKTGDRNLVLNTHIGYLDIATSEAVEKLKYDLSDVNPYISVDAAIVLAELGYPEVAYTVLKGKLSDVDKYIRMSAMRGLAFIGNDNSIELIKTMLNDPDDLVKERSELILNIPIKSSSAITSYSPANAASYAEQWWNAYNPAYANYNNSGGDCANFGSQCLKAGGMNLSNGPGLDGYGCIIACDNLHKNFTTYQGCNSSTTYSGHKTSGYPTWFTQGDIVLFGANSSNPNDPWQHTAINVVTGTPALDAHSNSRHKETVSYFYPSTGTGFKTADFYHFSSGSQTGFASVSQGITISPSTVISGSNFTVTFSLKETKGASITFESIVCGITNTNNTMVRDMEIKGPITISANSTYNYTSTLSWRSTDGTGNFRAWARGKVAGGNWFDFITSGGTNPKDFIVTTSPTPESFSLTLTPECDGTTSQIKLKWTSSKNATSYDVYRDGVKYPAGSGLTGTQFINSGNVTVGTSYRYHIKANNSVGSINSNVESATVPNCTPTPKITITSPNGGEDWSVGSSQTITWSSSDVTGNVQIQPYLNGVAQTNIASSASNTGSYNWSIPSNYATGTAYKIGISAMSGSVSDFSNNNFTISPATPSPCTITSLVPNAATHNPESFSTSSGDDIIVNGQANCTFSVTENCAWLTVTPMSGTTNSVKQAFLNYSIQANTSTSSRQYTFYVNGSPFTITQNGCSSSFSRSTKSVSGSGLTYDLDVDSYTPCSWNIQNSSSWVHLSQLSGTGSPTINVTVDPNLTCDSRISTLTISPGDETHTITQSSSLIAPNSPTSISATKMSIVNGQSTTLQVVGGTLNSAPEWVWFTGNCGGTQIGTGTTITVSPTVKTTYYVQATGCGTSTTCKSIIINNTTAVYDVDFTDKIKISPNPTSGKFDITEIELLGVKCKIEIFDYLGKSVYLSVIENVDKKISLDLSTYPNGIYFIRLSNNDATYQKKVIKK